jgi:exodeoxyribonuclease V alpha subunit
VNELRELFADRRVADRFDESDRLGVEHFARRASLDVSGDGPDRDLAVSLLELARAVRLDHVALSLEPTSLARHLGDDAAIDGTRLVRALVDESRRDRGLVELVPLSASVDVDGPPVVVSLDGESLGFAHIRRLAAVEYRLADWLLAAAREEAVPLNVDVAEAATAAGEGAARDILLRLARHRVTVVTGGPGTGKTTALARVVAALNAVAAGGDHVIRVALCAPTAKAAVRLGAVVRDELAGSSSTRLEIDQRSGSVHRLLGLVPGRPEPDEDLACDVVIVDEVSMLEMPLLEALLRRSPPACRVVLSGDPDQLASVNVGAALRDIVEGPELLEPLVVRLSENYRSLETVQQLAAAVNSGSIDEVERISGASAGDVEVSTSSETALAAAAEHVAELDRLARLEPGRALESLARFVVLCATRRGPGSVAWWNGRLRPPGPPGPGATVLVTRNEAARVGGDPLNNGDVGVVVDVDGELRALFPPLVDPRSRPLGALGAFGPADALTIHKSQGSEFDEVVISLPSAGSPILTRELLYTAVTRARQRVRIITDRAALSACLERRIVRVSALAQRVEALGRVRGDGEH